MRPVSTPVDLPCAECGEPMADGGVPLQPCTSTPTATRSTPTSASAPPTTSTTWVDRVRPVAVARSESEALWRGAPQTRLLGYLGCFVAILTALAVIVLVAFLIGRLLG